MGLSATQMRFLMVTARKSNVEYQGQQINQARTALANQSADLFANLMDLQAPTAPSIWQFIITPTENPAIDWTQADAYPLSNEGMKNFQIYYSANQPQFADFNIPVYEELLDDDGTVLGYKVPNGTDDDGNPLFETKTPDELTNTTFAYKTTGKDAVGNDVKFVGVHVNEDEFFKFDPETNQFTLIDGVTNPNTGKDYTTNDLPSWIKAYNLASGCYSTYSKPTKVAVYTQEYYNSDEFGSDIESAKKANVASYTSSASIEYNQAQYDAAMVQYQKDLEEYERACDEINAKTEEIHEADKKLELQLKQLDTEQEAIQTEYDALKKVLEKNIENTYKTFG